MKNQLAACFFLLSISGACEAQGSVTLYGRVDTGIEYVNGLSNSGNSHSRIAAEAGNWGANFWGLKGVEDLGDGTKAIFQLESGFNLTNGQNYSGGANEFQRWAYVGLASDKFGTVRLGRQFWISNGAWDFDPFGQTSWASQSLVRGRNWPNTSNDIAYQSPKLAGFDVAAQYGLSNATNWNGNGTTEQGRSVGAQLTYSGSAVQVRGIYDEIRDPANGKLTDVFAYSREYFLGANVFLGQWKLSLTYTYNDAPDTPSGAISKTHMEWAGVTYQFTPAAAVIAAVYHVNANHGGGSATLATLGGSYNLSKRTLLDIQVATVRNSKSANFSLAANGASSADNPPAGNGQVGIYAGIQHSF